MKKGLLAAIVLVLASSVLVQCKKSSSSPTNTSPYWPLTAGNSWTYKTTTTTTTTNTITATNKDTTINGKTYKVLTNSSGATNTYLGTSGSDYYRFGDFPAINANGIEELYLKDNLAVNGAWSASQIVNVPGSPFPLTANLAYSIKEKGISRPVEGKVYTDVIHVRLDISIAGLGSVGGGDFYYANGIGMIENNIIVSAVGNNYSQVQVLTAYTIK